jgi:hypothetical protein
MDMWVCVSTRLALRLDLELLHGDTRSAGYRYWPLGSPQERLQTHRWGKFFGALLNYLELLLR